MCLRSITEASVVRVGAGKAGGKATGPFQHLRLAGIESDNSRAGFRCITALVIAGLCFCFNDEFGLLRSICLGGYFPYGNRCLVGVCYTEIPCHSMRYFPVGSLNLETLRRFQCGTDGHAYRARIAPVSMITFAAIATI